jgi:hypothetical protein
MSRPFAVIKPAMRIHAEHWVIAALFLLTVINAAWLLTNRL